MVEHCRLWDKKIEVHELLLHFAQNGWVISQLMCPLKMHSCEGVVDCDMLELCTLVGWRWSC